MGLRGKPCGPVPGSEWSGSEDPSCERKGSGVELLGSISLLRSGRKPSGERDSLQRGARATGVVSFRGRREAMSRENPERGG